MSAEDFNSKSYILRTYEWHLGLKEHNEHYLRTYADDIWESLSTIYNVFSQVLVKFFYFFIFLSLTFTVNKDVSDMIIAQTNLNYTVNNKTVKVEKK